VQTLGREDVGLAERTVGPLPAVEPLVAEGGDLDPPAGARVGGAVVERAAPAGVPVDGGERGVERDRLGAGTREDQLSVAHRPTSPTRGAIVPGAEG
jgi:hypothetical protein